MSKISNRRERPLCRKEINRMCDEFGWSISELLGFTQYYSDDSEWKAIFWITDGLKIQARKMLDENPNVRGQE